MIIDSEVDEVAKEIISNLEYENIPRLLAIAGLCKAIVLLGDESDLDNACKMIDEFAERSDNG